jgi:hypothetical protein
MMNHQINNKMELKRSQFSHALKVEGLEDRRLLAADAIDGLVHMATESCEAPLPVAEEVSVATDSGIDAPVVLDGGASLAGDVAVGDDTSGDDNSALGADVNADVSTDNQLFALTIDLPNGQSYDLTLFQTDVGSFRLSVDHAVDAGVTSGLISNFVDSDLVNSLTDNVTDAVSNVTDTVSNVTDTVSNFTDDVSNVTNNVSDLTDNISVGGIVDSVTREFLSDDPASTFAPVMAGLSGDIGVSGNLDATTGQDGLNVDGSLNLDAATDVDGILDVATGLDASTNIAAPMIVSPSDGSLLGSSGGLLSGLSGLGLLGSSFDAGLSTGLDLGISSPTGLVSGLSGFSSGSDLNSGFGVDAMVNAGIDGSTSTIGSMTGSLMANAAASTGLMGEGEGGMNSGWQLTGSQHLVEPAAADLYFSSRA